MLSWRLLGALRGQVLRVPEEGPALLGSLGSLCPEKGHPDRGLSGPVHTACSQVLTDARCEPLRELLPQFIEGDSETAFLAAPN